MANPTTNYGFVLPTPTDLVTNLPADFEVALQGVDTQMFTNANAAVSATVIDAKGDLLAGTAADTLSRIAIGANNTVLTADSTQATGMKWAAAAAGSSGKVLQVVNATQSGNVTVTSTTYSDTNLSATITPTLSTSKILVMTTQFLSTNATDSPGMGIQILRDSTVIFVSADKNKVSLELGTLMSINLQTVVSLSYLDSPGTTSAITYKTQIAVYSTQSSRTCSATTPGQITLMEIGG
jgi:hypothetical protein